MLNRFLHKIPSHTITPKFGVTLRGKMGFTLIELLVVISVIVFLTAASLVMINNVRAKSRDAKRLADLKQIQTALDLYYDHYNQYPNYVDSDPADSGWDHDYMGDGFIKGLENNIRGDNPDSISFMTKVPINPTNNQGDSCYCCGVGNDLAYTYNNPSGRKGYKLCAAFEILTSVPAGFTFDCSNGNYPEYCITK